MSEICPVHNQHHLPYQPGDKCWDGKHTSTPKPTLGEPQTQHEHDEDGNAYNPSVIWDLSIGCTASIGYENGQLVALVSTSDEDKRTGITRRTVTHEQVAHYAHQLLALGNEEYRTALQGLYGIASKLRVDPKWSDGAQDLIGRIEMLGIEPLQRRAIAAEDQLGDIRHALAGEGFCAPDTDEWTSLSNIRARIQDLVDRAKKAEQEHAGLEGMAVQARDENSYHVARYQRMIAGAVGWDPEATYPGHAAAEEALAGLRERAERAGNPDIRDFAYRTMRNQRDEAIARANDAAAELGEAYRRGWRAGEVEKEAELDTQPCSCEQPHTSLYDGGITNLNCPVHGSNEADVERVARALMRVQHSGCLVWEDESAELRGHLTDQARAAIEALRGGDGA